MSKKLAFERFIWFHREVKAGRYPNASTLAERFEVSTRTARRDIEFMADRLEAPLEYLPARRGYRYTDVTFELPAIWLKREEIVGLLLAKRLAASIPDRGIKASLSDFLDKLAPFLGVDSSFDAHLIEEKISMINIEYSSVNDRIFQEVIDALFREETLFITYYSPHRNEETKRPVLPLHLLNYMGSWHLIAWCGLKGEMRDFALSRIRRLEPAKEALPKPVQLPPMKDYLRKQFGIFSGKEENQVVLRFSPTSSRWVREQIWHKAQQTGWGDEGRMTLKLPVSDFREIKREILKFGGEVEVLEPEALREEVKEEIEKMGKIYG